MISSNLSYLKIECAAVVKLAKGISVVALNVSSKKPLSDDESLQAVSVANFVTC
jgi:hypothetical protein